MTSEEARELFSEAYDGELGPEPQAAFDEALAGDDALRAEYEEFRDMLNSARSLAEGDLDGEAPDILAGVQGKLRARSRGRFYRDRFAEQGSAKGLFPMLLAMAMLVIVVVAWLMMHFIQVDAPRATEGRGSEQTTSPP